MAKAKHQEGLSDITSMGTNRRLLPSEEDGVEDGAVLEEVEEDEKRVYAKWKATEILKAIKEGREVVPGGYGEMADDPEEPLPSALPPPMSSSPPPPLDIPDYETGGEMGTEVNLAGHPEEDIPIRPDEPYDIPKPIPVAPAPAPVAPAPAASLLSWMGGSTSSLPSPKTTPNSNNSKNKTRVSKERLEDAVELTKFALRALESKDTDLGASRLEQALKCLGKK